MTKEEFIKNNKGIDNGNDLPTDYLSVCFIFLSFNIIYINIIKFIYMQKNLIFIQLIIIYIYNK